MEALVAADAEQTSAHEVALLPRIALLVCFVASGGCLSIRDTGGLNVAVHTSTIYPWWLWALVVLGAAAAAVSVVWRRNRRAQGSALAVTAITAAQVAGSGIVAFKHWKPASGMGGTYGGRLETVEDLALVMAVLGLVAAVGSLWLLVQHRDLPQRNNVGLRAVAVAAGVIVGFGVPIGLGQSSADMKDLTSWGAVSLIYAWPWGFALLAVGWASRTTGLAAAGTVCLSACLAAIGPQMTDLVFGTAWPFFGCALAMAVLVLAVRWTSRT